MSKKGRRKYDTEFKRGAVRLVLEEGRKASEVERNLGRSPQAWSPDGFGK